MEAICMARTHIATKTTKIKSAGLIEGGAIQHGGDEIIARAILAWLQGRRDGLTLHLSDGQVVNLKPSRKLVEADSTIQLEILKG